MAMDPTAQFLNLTVDDFDSVVIYKDVSAWSTPDPSAPLPAASTFREDTWHKTNGIGASFTFRFEGPAIYVYGASGPSYGSFTVKIDSDVPKTFSAYAPVNASNPYLLFKAANLANAKHAIEIANLGPNGETNAGGEFLFDFLDTTFRLAPAGAVVTNTTIEETDPQVKYTGTWGHNSAPEFSGGTTTFTNEDGASAQLSFHGSAIYVFGDKNNDHGLYSVTLDNNAPEIFNGVAGCGGAFGKTCEQIHPGVAYFSGNLGLETHTITIRNMAGAQRSFFDLDRFVVSDYTIPPSQTTSGTLTNTLPSSTRTPSNGASPSNFTHPVLLLIVAVIWVLPIRRLGRL